MNAVSRKRQEAPHIPFAQHRLVGVDIDREIEEVGDNGHRLAVARQPAGLQHVDALDDQDVGLVDLDATGSERCRRSNANRPARAPAAARP